MHGQSRHSRLRRRGKQLWTHCIWEASFDADNKSKVDIDAGGLNALGTAADTPATTVTVLCVVV